MFHQGSEEGQLALSYPKERLGNQKIKSIQTVALDSSLFSWPCQPLNRMVIFGSFPTQHGCSQPSCSSGSSTCICFCQIAGLDLLKHSKKHLCAWVLSDTDKKITNSKRIKENLLKVKIIAESCGTNNASIHPLVSSFAGHLGEENRSK